MCYHTSCGWQSVTIHHMVDYLILGAVLKAAVCNLHNGCFQSRLLISVNGRSRFILKYLDIHEQSRPSFNPSLQNNVSTSSHGRLSIPHCRITCQLKYQSALWMLFWMTVASLYDCFKHKFAKPSASWKINFVYLWLIENVRLVPDYEKSCALFT